MSRTLLAALSTIGLLLAACMPVFAQARTDVSDAPLARLDAPLPPPSYARESLGDVSWTYPPAAESEVRALQRTYATAWPELARTLGGDLSGPVDVRVALDPERMAQLAPPDAPPPTYASGVAYPAQGLVLLALAAPETWQRPDLDRVLVHELAHVALHRAVGGRAVPRWYTEGVAIHASNESSLERTRVLWEGSVRGSIIPLRQLGAAFSARPHQVNLAYAEAASFVGFLQMEDPTGAKQTSLVSRMRDGAAFPAAFHAAYGSPLSVMEGEWTRSMSERYTQLPLVATGATVWVIVMVLLGLAFWRRRAQSARTLARWAAEEAALREARLQAEHEARLRALDAMVASVPLPPRDAPPTIEHDGRSHTLH